MAISDRPWSNITEADYADAADYCAACLIDMNPPGEPKTKGLCKLPVREPKAMGGALSRAGAHAVASVLAGGRGGVNAPPEAKRTAARKLVRLYAELKEDPPASVLQVAGM